MQFNIYYTCLSLAVGCVNQVWVSSISTTTLVPKSISKQHTNVKRIKPLSCLQKHTQTLTQKHERIFESSIPRLLKGRTLTATFTLSDILISSQVQNRTSFFRSRRYKPVGFKVSFHAILDKVCTQRVPSWNIR